MTHEKPPQKPAVTRVSLTKARADLGTLVERVAAGSECVIEFEDYLELNDPVVSAAIAESRKEYLAGKSRPAEESLRELEEAEERERQPEKTMR